MALNSIETEWRRFIAMVLPQLRPGQTQYDEMKKAFFAGAWAVFTAVEEIGEPHISEQQGMNHLELIRVECQEFKSSVLKQYGEMN